MNDLKAVLDPPDLVLRFLEDEDTLKKEHPISWRHIRMLHNLYTNVCQTSKKEGEKIIIDYLSNVLGDKIDRDSIYQTFFNAIKAAKDFRQSLIREFIPDAVRFPLTSDGVVSPTTDPVCLLKIIFDPPGDRRYRQLRSFTANALWHLGQRYLIMRTENQHPESHLRDLTLQLEKYLFTNNQDNTRSQDTATVIYDPSNLNRFLKFGNNHDVKNSLKLMLEYRFIRINNQSIRVLYDSRVKKEDDIFRKTLINSQAESPIAFDTCGITLVFFTITEAEKAFITLTDRVFTNNAAITNLKYFGNGGKKQNEYSAGTSQPIYKFLVRASGAIVEVQMLLFEDYFNQKLSCGPENHHLYRLRQVMPLLRYLCPKELYYNWDDPNVIKILEAMQMQKIMTNYLGIPLPKF